MADLIVLAAGSERACRQLCELTEELLPDAELRQAGDTQSLLTLLTGEECAAAVILPPLGDGGDASLWRRLAEESLAGILLLLPEEKSESMRQALADTGVTVLSRPISRAAYGAALACALSVNKRLQSLRRENLRLHRRLDEQQLVSRAKLVLIQYLSMTEEQAHRHIEKQAMDTRRTRAEVAKSILSTYDLRN